MSAVHPTAILGKNVELGQNVQIGPYAVVEDNVHLGDGTRLLSHVFVGRGTVLGKKNIVHIGAVLGHEAQHKAAEEPEKGLVIGHENVFREYVTVHKSAFKEGTTRIGDRNYFMVSSHVGHDCQISNDVTVTNAVLLGGHAKVEDRVLIGGGAAVHQLCRIGRLAMIGGCATVTKDLPPYMLVDDNESLVGSINVIGLRRAGFSEIAKREIKNAYKLLYLSGLSVSHALEAIDEACSSPEVRLLTDFIRVSERGILGHRRTKGPQISPSALSG